MGKTCRSGLGKNAPQLVGGAEYSSPSPGRCPCMSPFPRQPLPLSPVSWYPEELTLELVRPGLNLPLISLGFRGDSGVKNPPANGRHVGSASGPGRSPGEGNGTPLQYPCLENPMDTGAWRASIHEVTKSGTQLISNNLSALPVRASHPPSEPPFPHL